MKRKLLLTGIVGLLMLSVIGLYAAPVENVSAKKHPNLAAAQTLIDQAFEKLVAAQKANEFDMDGNAANAKELLSQASAACKKAAMAANANKK
jgi:hypothetical protein